jgi:hypothetical protein
MDPRDVESSADVRDAWDEWDYDQRLDALGALANAHLEDYGYDDVDVFSEEIDGYDGMTDDSGIYIDPDVLQSPDADHAIHVTNHETVHVMNSQDGIEDGGSLGDLEDPAPGEDFDFTLEEVMPIFNHVEVGDQARVLDQDGKLDRRVPDNNAGFDGSGAGASDDEEGGDLPLPGELTMEIDWAAGVVIDTETSIEVFIAPMEGW